MATPSLGPEMHFESIILEAMAELHHNKLHKNSQSPYMSSSIFSIRQRPVLQGSVPGMQVLIQFGGYGISVDAFVLLRFIRANCGVRKLPNNLTFCFEGYLLMLSVDHVRLIPQSITVAPIQYLELRKYQVLVRDIVHWREGSRCYEPRVQSTQGSICERLILEFLLLSFRQTQYTQISHGLARSSREQAAALPVGAIISEAPFFGKPLLAR